MRERRPTRRGVAADAGTAAALARAVRDLRSYQRALRATRDECQARHDVIERLLAVLLGTTEPSDSPTADHRASAPPAPPPPVRLSPRQSEILYHIVQARSLREIARRLGIAEKTADNHRARLMRKLGVHNRVSLIRLAIRDKLVPIDDLQGP